MKFFASNSVHPRWPELVLQVTVIDFEYAQIIFLEKFGGKLPFY